MIEHRNYIAGAWSGEDFRRNSNPSDLSDTVGMYARATEHEVDRAIEAAAEAQPGWAALPVGARASYLDAIGSMILARASELGELLAREEGKTRAEGIGEAARAGQTFRYYAAQILQATGERFASTTPGTTIDVDRRPLGVIGIITPWNFPLAIPAWKAAPALAYGNTVVMKPADLVPGSAWLIASIIHEAGVPAGVFNLVLGSGRMIGARLVESPLVDGITFTGSTQVGMHIAGESLRHGAKRFQLEMGGKNPLLVLDDADIDVAVAAAVAGTFYSTGQRCTASSRLVVQSGIHDVFVERLTKATSELVVGHALEATTEIGPVVSESQLQQDLDYVRIGRDEGAEVLTGGEVVERATEGNFMQPTLFAAGRNDMRINREEIFGPVACVIRVDDYEEGLAVANDTEYGLSSGVVTTSLSKAANFRAHAQAGIITINRPTANTEMHVPFGGTKASSFGAREQGPHAREFFTTMTTTYTAHGTP